MPRLSKVGAAALAAFGWTGVTSITASYLVVAGGGGAGNSGGGAGGFRTGTASLNPTLTYTETVGGGGALNTKGGNSVFSTITSTGGGLGSSSMSGGNGGSGGGGGNDGGTGGTGNEGGFSPSEGNNGGTRGGAQSTGGGGGAGAVGGNGPSSSVGGNGGNGSASSITGTSVTYAGGGGGAGLSGGGTGGTGGGGAAESGATRGQPGTANTGGGGGGGYFVSGDKGGSGIVIISYVGAQQFGGGVVTSVGGNTIHTFTTSGTLVPITPLSASYLIVAGGGGGGRTGGGGGAGGLLSGSGVAIDTNSTYLVTVGAGGNGTNTDGATGASGSNSAFSAYVTSAVGGGGGGSIGIAGANGGSGGGGGTRDSGTPLYAGGTGTSGQGNAGGTGGGPFSARAGGGGGGAGAVGANATSNTGGAGGNGSASSISGTSVTYAGGGGGMGTSAGSAGGTGGGGSGATGSAGTANTGGGGGGNNAATGGNGGSGIVIISYAGATQLMAGGTVTISGGNVIHTFTSSGYLTPIKFVGNSLRFRSSATAFLSRTPSVASSRTTWTWSGWVKRGTFGSVQELFMAGAAAADYTALFFNSTDTLSLHNVVSSANAGRKFTSALYRDPSAWYHMVAVFDTTNATANDRIILYVNGVRITSYSVDENPSASQVGQINNNVIHTISKNSTAAVQYIDGYLTEVNFIDGQALTPNSFGTFNSYGVWQPITYGGSYGTNGFYLPFSNTTSTTTLGYDFSPQGNNWTTNNISLTAGTTYDSMTDVPTLTSATAANYAVFNPVNVSGGGTTTITNGNLATSVGSTTTYGKVLGSIGMSTGKWYWEVTVTAVGGAGNIGIGDGTAPSASFGLGGVAGEIAYQSSGNKYTNNSGTAYGATYTTNDIIGVAYDADAGSITFYKNNASQGAITGFSGTKFAAVGSGGGTNPQYAINFGQRPLTYTPPSGFLALNTFNL
jgi:hypothetical protein